jgi:hypothetical protein
VFIVAATIVLIAGAALTEGGGATADGLIGARCEALHALLADWRPDDDPRVNDVIDRLARVLAAEPPLRAQLSS